jgi:glycosyltransferase involved in cell wall biosynthesis
VEYLLPMALAAPVLTVVMTHYGCEHYLAEAVGSILRQSYRDLELHVADDCSSDGRWLDSIKQFRSDSRLRLFSADKNVGTYRLKARMIEDIRSEYIGFQDSDDISEASRFEQQVAILARKHFDIVGSGCMMIDESGNGIGRRRFPTRCNLLERLGKKHLVHHPATTVRRAVFDDIGSFDGTTRIGADSDFILRAAQRYRIGNLRALLYRYRIRPDSLTGSVASGYGSEARREYGRKMVERWKRNRRLGRAADLSTPQCDIQFELKAI